MTTYTIENQENQVDRAYLIDNQYNLAVAKSIVTGGTTVCNTIYQGSIIGPNMTVSWQEVYGVNFVLDIPTPGAKVTVKGIWQPLGLGEGYKLDNGGGWVANSGDKSNQPGFLNVLNEYDPHVHIVVGTQSQSTGEWSPIFFSKSALVKNGYGAYQPSEEVQLWYGSNQNPGFVIATQETPVKKYKFTAPDPHYFYYNTTSGTWYDQNTPYTPNNVHKNLGDPFTKLLVFTAAVKFLAKFITNFQIHMTERGWQVSVTVKTSANLEFNVLISKKDKHDNLGDDLVADIGAALSDCVKDGSLPTNENWHIL